MARRTPSGRKDGAARCYRLAPVSEDDAYEYVAKKLRHHGWTPIDTDVDIRLNEGGDYVLVALWAIPPAKELEEVSG